MVTDRLLPNARRRRVRRNASPRQSNGANEASVVGLAPTQASIALSRIDTSSRIEAMGELQRMAGNAATVQLMSQPPQAPATPTSANANRPMLQQGSRGRPVAELQVALNEKISASLRVDGVFGPATANAVRTFQTQAHLTADGIVGRKTWAELGEAVRSIQGPSPEHRGGSGEQRNQGRVAERAAQEVVNAGVAADALEQHMNHIDLDAPTNDSAADQPMTSDHNNISLQELTVSRESDGETSWYDQAAAWAGGVADQAGAAASQAASFVGETVGSAAEFVGETVSDAASGVGSLLGTSWDAASNFAGDVADQVEGAATSAAGFAGDLVQGGLDVAGHAYDAASDLVGDQVGAAAETARGLPGRFIARWSRGAERVAGWIGDALGVEGLPGQVSRITGIVREIVDSGIDAVVNRVRGKVDRIRQFVASLPDRIRHAPARWRARAERAWQTLQDGVEQFGPGMRLPSETAGRLVDRVQSEMSEGGE